jgi:zinc transporter ZupT
MFVNCSLLFCGNNILSTFMSVIRGGYSLAKQTKDSFSSIYSVYTDLFVVNYIFIGMIAYILYTAHTFIVIN